MAPASEANPFRELVRPGSSNPRYDIRVDAPLVARVLARGERPTDDMLLEAIGGFDPPLLKGEMLRLVAKELNPSANRGGRPPTRRTSFGEVADFIERSHRADLPPAFADALVTRLRTRDSFPERVRARRYTKLFRKLDRRTIMRGLYYQFMETLESAGEFVEIAHCGRFEVPHEANRSRRAMALTQRAMREKMGLDVPGIERMLNLIARKPPSFYVIDPS